MRSVKILCPKLVFHNPHSLPSFHWLIGSPFFPQFTILSSLTCLHTIPSSNSTSPNLLHESEELRALIIKGFEVIGGVTVGNSDDFEKHARESVDAVRGLRRLLYGEEGGLCENQPVLGGVAGFDGSDVRFFVSKSGNEKGLECVTLVEYEDHPQKYLWENGCLLRCQLPVNLPLYYAANNPNDIEKAFSRATEAVIAKLRDPQAVYMFQTLSKSSTDQLPRAIIRGEQLDLSTSVSKLWSSAVGDDGFDAKSLSFSYFSLKSKSGSPVFSMENADTIQVSVLFNSLEKSLTPAAPSADYLPVQEEARLLTVDMKLDILCYAPKELPLSFAVSILLIPGLVNQINTLKNLIMPNILAQHPQLRPYHFNPPGIMHPITVFYELSFGETELKQVEVRRSLHSRLGLPHDRPLLRIANALDFSRLKSDGSESLQKGSTLLRDVHIGIPSSGVVGGAVSLVQGSYEYHHYLQNGFNDSVISILLPSTILLGETEITCFSGGDIYPKLTHSISYCCDASDFQHSVVYGDISYYCLDK